MYKNIYHLGFERKAEERGDDKLSEETGYIGSCCGAYVAISKEEFLTCVQGICVFISDEDFEVPNSNEDNRFEKLKGAKKDFIYIHEALVPNYNGKLDGYGGPKREKRKVVKEEYCSIYMDRIFINTVQRQYYLEESNIALSKQKYFPYVFVILTDEQLMTQKREIFKTISKDFGELYYESPHFTANSNTNRSDKLKLFIFKKD